MQLYGVLMDQFVPLSETLYKTMLDGIAGGRWGTRLPSERTLAAELKVARMTLRKALRRLEAEGYLRRDRASGALALRPNHNFVPEKRPWRIGILVQTEKGNEMESWLVERLMIMQCVIELGHSPFVVYHPASVESPKLRRLAKIVDSAGADAWIVMTGPRPVLEWFDTERREPALAFGGRVVGLGRISHVGTLLMPALGTLVHELVALGHRRIVLIAPKTFREPTLAKILVRYQLELRAAGIQPNEYHLPDWIDSPEGLNQLLESLFRITPPTALIAWNEHIAAGVISFLSRRGLEMPDDVSFVTVGELARFSWHCPGKQLAHMSRNERVLMRKVMQWIKDETSGGNQNRNYLSHFSFVRGNTMGPAKSESFSNR